METVYTFPNGYAAQAESIYCWLRHYGLNPRWEMGENGKLRDDDGTIRIALPAGEIPCLRLMQHDNPARFGHAPKEE